jgi:adhesin/invasin
VRGVARTRTAGLVACAALFIPVLAASAATGPTISATGGTPQSATVMTAFKHKLSARVLGAKGNPRVGLLVTFKAPTTGASLTFANGRTTWTHATGTKGYVRVPVTANGTAGAYHVTANLKTGALKTPATFRLTNTP